MERAEIPGPRLHRTLEVLTAALTWVLITAPVWASLWKPEWWAIFFAAFSVYWLYKSATLAIFALIGYLRMRRATAVDWLAAGRRLPDWRHVHHAVILPTCGEPVEVIAESLAWLAAQDFPRRRVHVVLAFEARDPQAREKAEVLEARFRRRFGHLWCTFHEEAPGEVRGKSANVAFAARELKARLVDALGVPIQNVVLTVCDADSRLHPRFLSAVAYRFATEPEPPDHFYQPAVLFYANWHRIPLPLRALASMYSIMQIARLAQSYKLRIQSTYALPLATCHAVGYWDVDVIPEDSHMYFKVLFRRGGQVRVRPIYLPVLADAAEGNSFWGTVLSQYRQTRRWSWGVSDVPYVLWHGTRRAQRAEVATLARTLHYVQEHVLWPAHWFLLTGGLNLLPWVAPRVAAVGLVHFAAQLSSTMFSACLPFFLLMIAIDWQARRCFAERPAQTARLSPLSWACLPVTGLVLNVLPAVDAHTRLLLGRGLAYQVTAKRASASAEAGAALSSMPRRAA